MEEVTATEPPPSIAFEGKPDAALAGKYRVPDGTVYVLGAKGDFRFDGEMSTPQGTKTTHGEGQWARNGDRLLFKSANGVVPYKIVQNGKDMTLSLTGKMKNETLFKRQ